MHTSRISAISVVALVLTSVSQAAPQSLADVARAEQARRKATTGPTKTYTNEDLAKADDVPPSPPATGPAAATPGQTRDVGRQSCTGRQARPAGISSCGSGREILAHSNG